MAIGFTKSLMSKQIQFSTAGKRSVTDSDETLYGMTSQGYNNTSYAEKLTSTGLTFFQMKMMYISNVWVRACIDKIVERTVDVAPLIKPINTKLDGKEEDLPDDTKKHIEAINELIINPNSNYESFTNIKKKISRDLLIYDAAALEVLRGIDVGKSKRLLELYSVAGNTVKLNVDERGVFKTDQPAYIQVDRHLKRVTDWDKDKLIYYMMNPQSDRVYGLSPAESLVQTVTAELYASQFNLDFFYNNATPRFAVLMEGLGLGQGAPALNRFRTWWDNELKGQPHRPIVIGTEQGKITFQKVGMSNDEMQFQEYSRWLLLKIMVMYKMQPAVLGVDLGTNNKTNSEQQILQFKIEAVKPQLLAFAEKFNSRIIFSDKGFGFKDVYLDHDLDLVDKLNQAKWHEIYLRNGALTINEIRTKGLGLIPVPWGNVPYLQNNIVPFGQGKNGQAVPGNPDEANTVEASGENPANTSTSVSRSAVENFIKTDTGVPVGWEHMEIGERLAIVEKLVKMRESEMNKVYSFPSNKMLK